MITDISVRSVCRGVLADTVDAARFLVARFFVTGLDNVSMTVFCGFFTDWLTVDCRAAVDRIGALLADVLAATVLLVDLRVVVFLAAGRALAVLAVAVLLAGFAVERLELAVVRAVVRRVVLAVFFRLAITRPPYL